MKRLVIYLVATFLVGALAGGVAVAGECELGGGGKLDVEFGDVELMGIAKFGGSIRQRSEGSTRGAWFMAAADGSTFNATDFDDIGCTINGVDIADVTGVGVWNGEVVGFALSMVEDNMFDIPVTIQMTIHELGSTIEIARMAGNVIRGHAKVTVGSSP